MSNFCIRNIDLVVMMKKHVKLSANSNNVRGQVSRITQDTKSTTIYIYIWGMDIAFLWREAALSIAF